MNGVNLAPAGASSAGESHKKYQVVFVSSEVGPWSKTGGLGEVLDGLPIALAELGHRVMTIAPRYDQYKDAWDTSFRQEVEFGETTTTVGYFHCYKQKVDRVFVDHPIFLERVWGLTNQKFYGPKWGVDWDDNQLRFSLFAKAVIAAIKGLSLGGFPYGENVIIIVNDWHCALVPIYLDYYKKHDKTVVWTNTKIALLEHNMVYQGRFPYQPNIGQMLNLPDSYIQEMRAYQPLKVGRQHPRRDVINWLMGGIKYCDKLLTVSPTYAKEMMEGPIKGVELDQLVNAKGGYAGILNGIKDAVSPDSETLVKTAKLPGTFNAGTLEKKAEHKAALQKKCKLPINPAVPLFMFIGRLDFQKGVDIMLDALEDVLPTEDCQVLVVGQGREDLVEQVLKMAKKYPKKFDAEMNFKGTDKYLVYSGSDFALMPSRYEPCGLVQMEGMRFGVLPLVTPTGGLKDTVEDAVTGFVMEDEVEQETVVTPESCKIVADSIRRAIQSYKNTSQIDSMRKNAMALAKKFSWKRAAKEYISTFESMGVVDVMSTTGKGDGSVGPDLIN
ncbi:unnamed protein product [Vitrella brassicaformis CCMP3155]|uniref:Granule-bound starch synthase 1, chloroplastic/amyloplastic n=1 Tax=Vitrella brassicaformis (strain CCMP3155) TaxID=1169540 RepID=A0A0G4F185_VITBC|nr:unnamed protein product [Vitrella brassicaformis CCMP3155]|mmetsp:Transcript_5613/g.15685  ORF Transcript_5613/g.15685 Transcript_5613/m.15685 type:complete len:555 (-) Transcript_5613:79-1743(-)|eukprot:CEM05294.1 unnamed protein product [Vitrella brassicaformis CCMP3155]